MLSKKLGYFWNTLVGAGFGGLLGFLLISPKNGTTLLPNLTSTLAFMPILTGPILGIAVGGGIGGLWGFIHRRTGNQIMVRNHLEVVNIGGRKIRLRREALEIIKHWVQTAEVKVHNEVSTEHKTMTVPLIREDLVIEKIDLDGNHNHSVKTLRIPLRYERVQIVKEMIDLGPVSIFRRRFTQSEHVEATLKKRATSSCRRGRLYRCR